MAGLPGARTNEARPHEQVRAAVVLGGLILVSLAVWITLLVTTTPPSYEREVAGGPVGEPLPEELDGVVDGVVPTDRADSREIEGPTSDADPDTVLEFDGLCVVELDRDQQDRPRPWQFDACERAPIELSGSQTRWVVVVESLAGDDFTEDEALERIDAGDRGQELLWSSHYPSLNPGLWVVVDGPFDEEPSAVRQAERIGGGSYPRALSDDEGDRYCIAADGCVGETRG